MITKLFHIHIGYDNNSDENSLNIIKAMDLFLGVPSVLIDPDIQRRQLYGKAGCFRYTDFGIEYRVMSGHFLRNRDLTEWMFNQTFAAIDYLNKNGISEIENNMLDICSTINNCDKNLAEEIVNKFNIKLV